MSDVSSSTKLVLLFRIGTLDPNSELGSIEEQCNQIRSVLDAVPLGRKQRESQLGPLAEGEGNPVLDGYDCVIWTIDAMNALARANIISMAKLDCRDGGKQLMNPTIPESLPPRYPRKPPVSSKDFGLVPHLVGCMSRILSPPPSSFVPFVAS